MYEPDCVGITADIDREYPEATFIGILLTLDLGSTRSALVRRRGGDRFESWLNTAS